MLSLSLRESGVVARGESRKWTSHNDNNVQFFFHLLTHSNRLINKIHSKAYGSVDNSPGLPKPNMGSFYRRCTRIYKQKRQYMSNLEKSILQFDTVFMM